MIHFIVNIKSGKGKALRCIKKITNYCANNAIDFYLHITQRRGHGADIAKEIASKGEDVTIVAVGGDGTFHEVINGVAGFSNVTLGFIPCGRGNDFARTAGFSKNPINALKDILDGEITYFDCVQIGDKRCLNVAGTGLDVDVLTKMEEPGKKRGYLPTLISSLIHFKPYVIEYTVNGETREEQCFMIAVCNGTAFGKNMKICPPAKINDGKIDLVVINIPKGSIWPLVPKFLKGKHLKYDWTKHILCDEVKIVSKGLPIQMDGEVYDSNVLDCKIAPNAIKTFVVGKN